MLLASPHTIEGKTRLDNHTWLAAAGTLLAAAFAGSAHAQTAENCPQDRSPIMILGTYHMDNPGLDAVNVEADDVLSVRRQKEIADLVEKLARFRPTRVMLEAPYSSPVQQQRYEKYLAGQYELTRNETDQLGFRLARRMALKAVTPIDYQMMMSGLRYDEIEFKPQPAPAADPSKPAAPRQLSPDELKLRQSTVAEYLLYLNDPTTWRSNHLGYMKRFEPEPDNAAIYERTDYLTNWYKRNFRMFSNVVRKTERPKDRVFLLVGSGHLKILRDLAQDMPGFCLVEPAGYLR
jgi:hypothetical protein